MKWIETTESFHVIKLAADAAPLPILEAGQTQNHHWCFTGDFNHLVRLGGTKWEETGDRSGKLVDATGRTVAWVNSLEDTPEIIDKDQWRLQVAQIEAQMFTDDFWAWLDQEVAITN